MASWTRELLMRISKARSVEAAFEQIDIGARQLGFECCAYGVRLPSSFTRPKTLIFSSYPPSWRERYAEADYLNVDPTVAHGIRSLQPLVWSDRLFCGAPQMWYEARSFGLRVGWAQSCFDAQGRIGMLSLSRSCDRLGRMELLAHDPLLRWLVNTAHLALTTHLSEHQYPAIEPLTRRQIEVLRWTADGKTSEEIATILAISARTVNFHIRNPIANLRVNNRNSAIARSSRLGLLD
ncbi:autoinducer binding domain-containing protein [Variovorax sp. WS11]|uniref:autoinducer binding domain-containing protein n=1 Tax=Variovorax sp. WS11 TaxID=1105204 RepID=UPI0013DA39B6|nr:autoinducer binding domain-containing protein [Variovorax sp. WS11]NDZ17145.1 LuxR family transcriptional regulator [Variovorax sp. WS11]